MLTVSNSRSNPFQMYLPPQVLSPCPWNVPQLEGGRGLFAVAFGAWGLGAVTPDCEPWSLAFETVVPLSVPKRGTCIALGLATMLLLQ